MIPFGWPAWLHFLAAQLRRMHALAEKGGLVGGSGGHRRQLHRGGDKADGDTECSELVIEKESVETVDLVDCGKTEWVDEGKDW